MATASAAQAFAAQIQVSCRTYATYLARLRTLTVALAERPGLAHDVEWRTRTLIALTALRNAAEDLVPEGVAPRGFEELCECLRGVSAETESLAAEFVGQASVRGAAGLASGQLGRITAYLRRAARLLDGPGSCPDGAQDENSSRLGDS